MSEEAIAEVTATEVTESTEAPWYGTLDETLTPHQKLFDQFKDQSSALKSLADTKAAYSRKLEGHVKLPTEDSSPEEVAAYRSALGIPDSVDAYSFELPDNLKDMDWDSDALTPFKEIALESGVTPDAFNKLIAKQAELEHAQIAAHKAAIQESDESLVNEWGDEYQFKLNDIAGRVEGVLDLDQPYLDKNDVLRALDSLAKDFRNDTSGGGKPAVTGMSLDDQILEISKSDEYRSSMHPKHKETRAKLHSLYGEQARREAVGSK